MDQLPASLPLLPTGIWIILLLSMLLSLLPLPFQPFLRSLFLRGKLLPTGPSPPKFTVPQRYFLHFYIIGASFNGLLLLTTLAQTFIKSPSFWGDLIPERPIQESWRTIFVLLLFELHVLRRLLETIYVAKYSSVARMHIFAYLLGLLYYVLTPLSISPTAKEILRKTLQMLQKDYKGPYSLEIELDVPLSSLFELGWLHLVAGVVFFWGWTHQYRCHTILASLRSKNWLNKEDSVYKIPYGDWFEYVSSAHYFAEIVIYFSFIIACAGQNLNTWLLFAFVVLNLSIAAYETHNWYKMKFEEYPSNRTAIIPFIF